MGKVSKGEKCVLCDNQAVKSLPASDVSRYFNVKFEARRAYLCREHYKEYKKKSKDERELERLRW